MSITPKLPAKLALSSQSRFRVMDGEGIVILQRAAEVLVTNECGARILSLITAGETVEQVISVITDEYEVDDKTARGDIEYFVAELIRLGAVCEARPSDAP